MNVWRYDYFSQCQVGLDEKKKKTVQIDSINIKTQDKLKATKQQNNKMSSRYNVLDIIYAEYVQNGNGVPVKSNDNTSNENDVNDTSVKVSSRNADKDEILMP